MFMDVMVLEYDIQLVHSSHSNTKCIKTYTILYHAGIKATQSVFHSYNIVVYGLNKYISVGQFKI